MNDRQRYGSAAEERAAAYLRDAGYRIVARNVRGPSGEIDIVAWDGPLLAFVEVKARRTHSFGTALGAVDARKRKRLRAAAADYQQFVAPDAKARFDVLAIDGDRVRLVRNAFA